MNPSSLFFLLERKYIELELRSVEHQGAHEARGAARGVGAPHPHGQGVGPLALILCQYFLLFPKIISVEFQVIPRIFSAHK